MKTENIKTMKDFKEQSLQNLLTHEIIETFDKLGALSDHPNQTTWENILTMHKHNLLNKDLSIIIDAYIAQEKMLELFE